MIIQIKKNGSCEISTKCQVEYQQTESARNTCTLSIFGKSAKFASARLVCVISVAISPVGSVYK